MTNLGSTALQCGVPSNRENTMETDKEAFARQYREHYAAIANHIERRIADPHTAEDLTTEVFITAMGLFGKYRNRGINIRIWFLRIATNIVNRWLRKNHKRRMLSMADTSTVVDNNGEDAIADLDQLYRAFQAVPIKFQTVLSLHYFESLSLEEIAQVAGCRVGTVKSRLARGRAHLRQRLSQ